jgi:serine/threonine protein phosphatase PrpC
VTFKSASISKAGGREENQDCCDSKVVDHAGLWIVADGVGGHRGGAVASQTAVRAMLDSWHAEAESISQTVDELINAAQTAILKQQITDTQLSAMRTTVVALYIVGDQALWGHVGDSRLYFFRGCALSLQTKDHSVPQAMVAAGEITREQIRHHEDRNRLLRAVGNPEGVKPTIHESPQPVRSGDAFLMCTDGFWEYVTEAEMAVDLVKSNTPMEWLERMELRLVARAAANHDNYTALAVFISKA